MHFASLVDDYGSTDTGELRCARYMGTCESRTQEVMLAEGRDRMMDDELRPTKVRIIANLWDCPVPG